MRDQTDSRTLPLSLGKPARQRTGQSGAGFLPLSPAAEQEREFQRERIARARRCSAGHCLGPSCGGDCIA